MGWAIWARCLQRQCGLCRRANLPNWRSCTNRHANRANAPMVFESKLRGSHMAHAYDFCKLNLTIEYPVILIFKVPNIYNFEFSKMMKNLEVVCVYAQCSLLIKTGQILLLA